MVCGYDSCVVNEKSGLKQMREVTFDMLPADLRELADFFAEKAHEMETSTCLSSGWHRHIPEELADKLGCDVIIANGDESAAPPPRVI